MSQRLCRALVAAGVALAFLGMHVAQAHNAGVTTSRVAIHGCTIDLKINALRREYEIAAGAALSGAPLVFRGPAAPADDNLNFHGQTTFVWQSYPAFRSPYAGANSLPGAGNCAVALPLARRLAPHLAEKNHFAGDEAA
jgi:hypothetical protein